MGLCSVLLPPFDIRLQNHAHQLELAKTVLLRNLGPEVYVLFSELGSQSHSLFLELLSGRLVRLCFIEGICQALPELAIVAEMRR